jgi:hypothetical protein
MKVLHLPLLLALSALLLAPALSASTANPATGGKLYVTIETFDPIKFNDYRHGLKQSGDLVLSTLKETAAASAKLAGLNDEVVVLDDDVKAPAGAPVLSLTWTDGRKTVTADLTENGKNHFLGVVSRKDMLLHPEHLRLTRTLTSAALPEAHRDAVVRTETEMNLYFALKLTVDFRARVAAKP